jgi:excisionase family DNA binding protein
VPARDELEVLAVDLPRLWNAPTTSDKDRKRLLRTLIADVTLTSQLAPVGNQVHIGIRWRSGATEEIVAARPAPFHSLTSVEAVEFIKRLVGQADHEIAAQLTLAGLRTGSGQPFDVTAVRWVRYVHRIPSAHTDSAPGELTIPQVAARLQVAVSAIYHWVQAGRLPSRRTAAGRHRIMFSDEVEQACRQMIASSTRIHSRTQRTAGGVAV